MPIEQSVVADIAGIESSEVHPTGKWKPGQHTIIVADGDGKLLFLSDNITIDNSILGFEREKAASLGDVFINLGFLALIAEFLNLAGIRITKAIVRALE